MLAQYIKQLFFCVINIVFKMKVLVLGPFSRQFISILKQIKFHMASVEFCKIPSLSWPSMASMVAWTSIESIRWIPWKWSPIAPWIPQKLSVESMETNRKRRKFMPLNFALNFHCFLEVHGNGVQILHGSGSGIHGIPWISQRREWFMYYQMYFE